MENFPMPSVHGASIDEGQTRSKHRPRRTARQRREQLLRSNARCITRLVDGLTSIASHRGNTLSQTGMGLLEMLNRGKPQAGAARVPHNVSHMPVCRHFLRGKCTWGETCRFSHSGGEYNGADEHIDSCSDQNDDCSDNSDRQYNHDDNDNIEPPSQHGDKIDEIDGIETTAEQHVDTDRDDVDDIIDVLNALQHDTQAQHDALEALPSHLLGEVLERCEDYSTTSGQDMQVDNDSDALPQLFDPISGKCFDDPVEFPSLYGASLGTAVYDELLLDHNLRKLTWDFLATVNMNKKIARREFGDEAMNITFNISSDPLPSVPLSAGISETYVAPAQGGYVGNFASTATMSSGSQLGDFAAASWPDADLQHRHTSNTILEHVRTTLALLPLEKRWDAYVALPYATRKEILDRYPSVMCEEPLSEPD
mmetsp:Transcript_84165/g.132920  ORF Transcript_84165/g.132920 Transcript_84165/m.132920 type:complete len:424 (+) Transcript_84165:133-1404(+)